MKSLQIHEILITSKIEVISKSKNKVVSLGGELEYLLSYVVYTLIRHLCFYQIELAGLPEDKNHIIVLEVANIGGGLF